LLTGSLLQYKNQKNSKNRILISKQKSTAISSAFNICMCIEWDIFFRIGLFHNRTRLLNNCTNFIKSIFKIVKEQNHHTAILIDSRNTFPFLIIESTKR
jgi:hypothetical protein